MVAPSADLEHALLDQPFVQALFDQRIGGGFARFLKGVLPVPVLKGDLYPALPAVFFGVGQVLRTLL